MVTEIHAVKRQDRTYYEWSIDIDTKHYIGVNVSLEGALESIIDTIRNHEVRMTKRFHRTEY